MPEICWSYSTTSVVACALCAECVDFGETWDRNDGGFGVVCFECRIVLGVDLARFEVVGEKPWTALEIHCLMKSQARGYGWIWHRCASSDNLGKAGHVCIRDDLHTCCAGEEEHAAGESDEGEGEDLLPIGCVTRGAVECEADDILRNLSPENSDARDPDWCPASSGHDRSGATAAVSDCTGSPPLRKRGRPKGSKNRPVDPGLWDPREVSVTITGGARDIDPSKLDEMEIFLTQCCMAGMFALKR